MGKKRMAHKQGSTKPSSTTADKRPEPQPPQPQPPQPQPPHPTLTPQAPPMVSLDELAAYLKRSDPNRDWEATLAVFGRTGYGTSVTGGMSAVPSPIPEIPTTVTLSTAVQTSSTPIPEKTPPTETAPSASSKPSPIHQQTEPTDASPFSAYQDPYPREAEEKEREEEESEGGEEIVEETPVTKPTAPEKQREEIDLNETAKKQGLMTDEEFQSILDGVNMMEVDAAEVAEGLDLSSKAVDGGEASRIENESEGAVHQSEEKVEGEQFEEGRPKSVTPQSGAGEGTNSSKRKSRRYKPRSQSRWYPRCQNQRRLRGS